jgi:hypothetical protein
MVNPAKTKAKLEKVKDDAEDDLEAARAKTEAKIAKAKTKLQAAEAQAAADVEMAEIKARANLAKVTPTGRSGKKKGGKK